MCLAAVNHSGSLLIGAAKTPLTDGPGSVRVASIVGLEMTDA
jgi:hypothetical protein